MYASKKNKTLLPELIFFRKPRNQKGSINRRVISRNIILFKISQHDRKSAAGRESGRQMALFPLIADRATKPTALYSRQRYSNLNHTKIDPTNQM